jgi:cell division protease FtsH
MPDDEGRRDTKGTRGSTRLRPRVDRDEPPSGGGRDEGPPPKGVNFKSSRLLFLLIFVGLVIAVVAGTNPQFGAQMEELTDWNEFRERVEKGQVKSIEQVGREFQCLYADGVKVRQGVKGFRITGPDTLTDEDKRWLYEARKKWPVTLTFKERSQWPAILLGFLPWVVLFLFVYLFIFRQLRGPGGPGGVLSFGKSRATLITKDKSKKNFKDVAGIDEARAEVEELVMFLKNPRKFQRLGGRIPKGVLLIGPPGTGKTLLAKAIAGEANVPFYSISGSDFVEMFVGVGASRVRDLFQQARENSPCIIFLDEIDAVGRRRGTGLGGGHDEREQTLNEILVQMDGMESDDKIIVMAATNRPDVLDPALLRPGRFDRHVYVDLPDIKGREQILHVHARKIKMSPDSDLSILAKTTPMFSGADLENIINESALLAVIKDKDAVDMADLEEARDKVVWGREKKSRVMDEADRWVTAYHEAGHALLGFVLPHVDKPHKVTIIPRGPSLGGTHFLPTKDVYTRTRKELLGQIMVAYGGRIAEEMFMGDLSTGAKADIEQASAIARRMVCEWGMSDKLGPVKYQEDEETVFLGREITRTQNHSQETALLIDQEIRSIIDGCYVEARKELEAHRPDIELVAKALMEYEVIAGDELAALLKERKLPAERRPLKQIVTRKLPGRAEGAGKPVSDEAPPDAADAFPRPHPA